jgi:hypothetical protein
MSVFLQNSLRRTSMSYQNTTLYTFHPIEVTSRVNPSGTRRDHTSTTNPTVGKTTVDQNVAQTHGVEGRLGNVTTHVESAANLDWIIRAF